MSSVLESPRDNAVTLIDALLAEQRSLTAVARFARKHEEHALPAQARFYRDLIPLTKPAPGEQYAFEVDLDQCTGCKGCVTACHSLNGLDDEESWRSVGLLLGGINGEALQQTVTTACHHCVDPGCLNGCPVLAYEKDPLTGIVRHLDDQCIGCQYCVMKCPYDVPKYSERLGIVRKCDLCHQRLAVGEAPACVQACPNEAIKVTLANPSSVTAAYRGAGARENPFLAASPAPDYTLPTTIYKTQRPQVATLRAADETALKPQPAHWPLVFLLVLSQASVGGATGAWLAAAAGQSLAATRLVMLSVVLMAVALGIGTLHLGRPAKAWRVFLGWRRSWFSREAIAFGGYFGAASLAATMIGSGRGTGAELKVIMAAAALLGFVSVFCSLMLYVDTRREFWSLFHTGTRFVGSTALLGLAAWLVTVSGEPTIPNAALFALIAVALVKLACESTVLRHRRASHWTPLKRTARLMLGRLRIALGLRIALALLGGVVLPGAAILGLLPSSLVTTASLVLLLAGELAERYLFFTAVSPTQMPGGLAA